MKKYKVHIIVLSILLIVAVYYIRRPLKVEMVEARKDIVVESVYATGSVESEVMYPLSSQLSARLVELYVDEGDTVKKDQVLATLDGTEFKELEQQLKIREKFAQEQYERADKLYKSQAISIDEFNRTKSEWLAAQASTRSAKGKSEYTIIRAVNDGVVIRRDGEVGQLIPANQVIFWIAENGNLRITAEVDEEEILKIKEGQKVYMQADALPEKVLEGSIIKITPRGDSLSRSYRVRISLPKESPLMIGMTVENNILIGEKANAVVIPTSCVKNGFVWVVDADNRVSNRKIKIGVKGLENSEVLSGVEAGEKLVNNPPSNLKDGVKVRW